MHLIHRLEPAKNGEATNAALQPTPGHAPVEVVLDNVGPISQADDLERGIGAGVGWDELLEDVADVVLSGAVLGDAVLLVRDQHATVDGAGHGGALGGDLPQGAAELGGPDELARVGNDDTGGGVVFGSGLLLLQCAHDGDEGAAVDATGPSKHAVRQDTEVLYGLAEDEDDARLGLQVGAREDGHVGLRGGSGTERQEDLLQTEGLEAAVNLFLASL